MRHSKDGDQLLEIGKRNAPAEKWSGEPFNQPTSAAIRPRTGDVYVSDGYGNSRIHVYTGSGEYKFSWGRPGIDAGQFIAPHGIAVDSHGDIYVAEVSYSIRGRNLKPPQELRSISKYRRVS